GVRDRSRKDAAVPDARGPSEWESTSNGARTAPTAPDAAPGRTEVREWGKGTRSVEEGRVLHGPEKRRSEFARVLRISGEFIRGFRAMHFVGHCVPVFGSARFLEDHRYYAMARDMGGRISRLGFTVMTGGGPGIMEAANRGAKEAGG